jgi:hypothetical protein
MAARAAKLTAVLSRVDLCVLNTEPTFKLQNNTPRRHKQACYKALGLPPCVHDRVAVVDQPQCPMVPRILQRLHRPLLGIVAVPSGACLSLFEFPIDASGTVWQLQDNSTGVGSHCVQQQCSCPHASCLPLSSWSPVRSFEVSLVCWICLQ